MPVLQLRKYSPFPDGERNEESDDECSDSEDENKTTVEELLQQAELQKAVRMILFFKYTILDHFQLFKNPHHLVVLLDKQISLESSSGGEGVR